MLWCVVAAVLMADDERYAMQPMADVAGAAAGVLGSGGVGGLGLGVSAGAGAMLNETVGVSGRITAVTAIFVGLVQPTLGAEFCLSDRFWLNASVGAAITTASHRGLTGAISAVAPLRFTWLFTGKSGWSAFVEAGPGLPLFTFGRGFAPAIPQLIGTAAIGLGYSLRETRPSSPRTATHEDH